MISIANYDFEGPYINTTELKNSSGVYVIVSKTTSGYEPIDCGESEEVKNRITNHDRSVCWRGRNKGTLMVAVLYTLNNHSVSRTLIEQNIRSSYDFPCGIR